MGDMADWVNDDSPGDDSQEQTPMDAWRAALARAWSSVYEHADFETQGATAVDELKKLKARIKAGNWWTT